MFAGKVSFFKEKRQLSHPDYQLIPDGDDEDEAIAKFARNSSQLIVEISKTRPRIILTLGCTEWLFPLRLLTQIYFHVALEL